MIAILVFFFIRGRILTETQEGVVSVSGTFLWGCFIGVPHLIITFYLCLFLFSPSMLSNSSICYKSLPHFQRSQPKSSTFIKLIGYCLNWFIIFCLSSGNTYSSQTAGSTTCPLTSISLPLSIMIYHLLNYQFFSKL